MFLIGSYSGVNNVSRTHPAPCPTRQLLNTKFNKLIITDKSTRDASRVEILDYRPVFLGRIRVGIQLGNIGNRYEIAFCVNQPMLKDGVGCLK